MARRKMFKQIALFKTENIGHTGGIVEIARFFKQQGQMSSAYIDKVRISWISDVTDTNWSADSENSPPLAKNLGLLFFVCTNNTGPDSEDIVGASASRGNGGVVTIEVKRRIVDNDFDENSGVGALSLLVSATNPDLAAGDITLNSVVEVWGRWHDVVSA